MNRSLEMATAIAAQRSQGEALAQSFRLNLRQPKAAGTGGNWLGVGSGSSVDFQDHRSYAAGDDPRYINWQAYARTGEYVMKLYRDEVSPALDIVFDASLSVCGNLEKRDAALALFHFCVASAAEQGAAVKGYVVRQGACSQVDNDAVANGQWLAVDEATASGLCPQFESVPWRTQSARIVISDLLFPGMPDALLGGFAAGGSWKALVRVFAADEARPSWSGGVKLVDSETTEERVLYCDQKLMASYRKNYDTHFSLWKEFARRRGVVFSDVESGKDLEPQLREGGIASGLVSV